jgi:gamma-glutamyltranspeptidase/glutathione hydrolase
MTRFLSLLGGLGLLLRTEFIDTACAQAEDDATHGMVVTTTGEGSAAAGVALLKRGGTAMDAAMAATMLQPCLAAGSYVSYAGITNVVYFQAASGKVYNLSAGFNTVRGETDPLSIPGVTAEKLAAGGVRALQSAPSGRTALVPGFLAGVETAHRKFGKRPFGEILAPAIQCAEFGFTLSPAIAGMMQSRKDVLQRLPETRAIFTKPDGNLYAAGDQFKQPALARTLQTIAKKGVSAYVYRGDWARAFVAAVQREGGKMTLDDLMSYSPTWTEPAHGQFNGYDVYAHGLPSDGGLGLIEGLHLANAAKLASQPPYKDSPLSLFWLMQIAKVSTLLSSPGESGPMGIALNLDLSPQARLKQSSADRLWSVMQTGAMPTVLVPKVVTTAHSDAVVAVDGDGNVAAVVHSINTVTWGSTGIFVAGISIPDSASFQQALIASLPPGSRLPDNTNPGIALKNGKAALGFSAIGSGLNVRSLAALVDTLGHRMTPQEAIASPALGGFDYSKATSGELIGIVGEKEFSADYLRGLRDLGQSVKEDNAERGYWIGISVNPNTRALHGGALRELALGGSASGY